jgi:HAD superfamily hydrolase (TIGR01509 family)
VRACIFDLDGTVVDSHAYTFAAFRAACAGVARPPTDAEIFAAFGPPERVILERLLPPAALEPAYARLQAYYATHAAGLEMHPEMRPLLGDCRAAGMRLGLFTGRGADSTSLVLRQLDLEWAFDAVVAGAMAVRPKPAPDGVVQLLERLGAAAGDALVVGDSPLDLQAAGRAGVAAVFATWHAWPGVVPPPDAVLVTRPDALRERLGLGERLSGGEP